jgi:hypothetical protein
MAQPALSGEGKVQCDGGDGASGDEERLECPGANVANIWEFPGLDGWILFDIRVDEPVDEHREEHAKPHNGGYDWKPLSKEMLDGDWIQGRRKLLS